ncbi:hypothetical protein FWG76_02730 [Candidatus Saccharibacteria bacterium]|nr:hypothetical protein [Candidatus Saccharibacteria bacterium]
MDNTSAIASGALANNSLFFGASLAEIVSRALDPAGWNSSRTHSLTAGSPWFSRSSTPDAAGAGAGIFRSGTATTSQNTHSHRTILLGY